MNDWKPGTVAMVKRGTGEPPVIAFRFADQGRFGWLLGERRLASVWVSDDQAEVVRPLVVIDPENSEDVERFREIASRWADQVPYSDMREPGDLTHLDAMQEALREFMKPEPPKPVEPTSLAARVIDKEGDEWGKRRDGMWVCLTGVTYGAWAAGARQWLDLLKDFGPVEVIEP